MSTVSLREGGGIGTINLLPHTKGKLLYFLIGAHCLSCMVKTQSIRTQGADTTASVLLALQVVNVECPEPRIKIMDANCKCRSLIGL